MYNTIKTIDAANLGLATLEAIAKSLPVHTAVKAGATTGGPAATCCRVHGEGVCHR